MGCLATNTTRQVFPRTRKAGALCFPGPLNLLTPHPSQAPDFKYFSLAEGSQDMDQQWINLSNCILPGFRTVAPRGAHFFHIVVLYYFHGGSSTLVFFYSGKNMSSAYQSY